MTTKEKDALEMLKAMLAAGYVDVSCAGSPEDEKAVEIIRKAISALEDLEVCRNELCLYCGQYKQRHLGACDGCRWKEEKP